MKLVVLVVLVFAALSLVGCAGQEQCIILANGGNKLCGSDAAAWCRSTDSIRQGATDPGLQQAQSDCAQLESDYPQ